MSETAALSASPAVIFSAGSGCRAALFCFYFRLGRRPDLAQVRTSPGALLGALPARCSRNPPKAAAGVGERSPDQIRRSHAIGALVSLGSPVRGVERPKPVYGQSDAAASLFGALLPRLPMRCCLTAA